MKRLHYSIITLLGLLLLFISGGSVVKAAIPSCIKNDACTESEFYTEWSQLSAENSGEVILISDTDNLILTSDKSSVSGFTIYGQTVGEATIKVYIFSDPSVWTTVSDADGNWSIDVTEPVTKGSHEVFIVATVGDISYKAADVKYLAVNTSPLSVEFADITLPATGGTVTNSFTTFFTDVKRVLPAIIVLLLILGTAGVYIYNRKTEVKPKQKPKSKPLKQPQKRTKSSSPRKVKKK